jgi:hypothetical protein
MLVIGFPLCAIDLLERDKNEENNTRYTAVGDCRNGSG